MSGHVDTIVGTKKIVRFYVCGESDTLKRKDRHFKIKRAAVDHLEDMALEGYTNLQFYKNTKTFETERIL